MTGEQLSKKLLCKDYVSKDMVSKEWSLGYLMG